MASRLGVSMARFANASSVQRLTVRTVASRSLPCLGEHTGTVKWFNPAKRYGFILDQDGQKHFVHYRAIQSDGYKSLGEGETVEFDLEMVLDIGQLGKMKAVNVTRSNGAPVKGTPPTKPADLKGDREKVFDLEVDLNQGNIGKMRAVDVKRSNGAPVKADQMTHTGTVKSFSREGGYGFILDKDGQEYFVHYSGIKSGKFLVKGESVRFDLEIDPIKGNIGKMRAVDVTRSNGAPVKADQMTHTGTVKWYNVAKGCGFIVNQDGQEHFVHYSAIKSNGLKSLRKGESVEFDLVIDPRKGNIGMMRAVNVTGSNGAPVKGAPPFKPRDSS